MAVGTPDKADKWRGMRDLAVHPACWDELEAWALTRGWDIINISTDPDEIPTFIFQVRPL